MCGLGLSVFFQVRYVCLVYLSSAVITQKVIIAEEED